MSAESIALTMEMIERRDGLRQLLGAQYAEDVEIARAVLRGVAAEGGIGIAKAALQIGQRMAAAGVDPGIMIAALVDEAQERGEAFP